MKSTNTSNTSQESTEINANLTDNALEEVAGGNYGLEEGAVMPIYCPYHKRKHDCQVYSSYPGAYFGDSDMLMRGLPVGRCTINHLGFFGPDAQGRYFDVTGKKLY